MLKQFSNHKLHCSVLIMINLQSNNMEIHGLMIVAMPMLVMSDVL